MPKEFFVKGVEIGKVNWYNESGNENNRRNAHQTAENPAGIAKSDSGGKEWYQ